MDVYNAKIQSDGSLYKLKLRIVVVVDLHNEYGSEVSHFIPEPRNFAEVTRLSDDINKPCLKSTQK